MNRAVVGADVVVARFQSPDSRTSYVTIAIADAAGAGFEVSYESAVRISEALSSALGEAPAS